MSLNSKFPRITMELYETDKYILQEFISNKKVEEEFTEEYLILYNFATDCRYSKCIQSNLIRYLLPFYFKVMEQAVFYKNKIAMDIYFEFNLAIFINQKKFKEAVGEIKYQYIMDYYIKQAIKKMENSFMLEWVSLFNTTVALCDDNIRRLFCKIFEGSLKIKYSFFQYLSVLIFKESDNLLAVNETKVFWNSDVWDFDDGYFANTFFWSDVAVDFFDKEISKERIENLYNEIKPLICNIFEPEIVDLLNGEIQQSFLEGVFYDRKAEYLRKIASRTGEYMYWDTDF